MPRNSSETAALSTADLLRDGAAPQRLDHEEHQDREGDEQGRAYGGDRGELDADDLPHLDRQGLGAGAGEEDRDHDLVERGDEGEGGAAGKARQDQRQGDGAEDPPMRGAEPL